MILAIDFDDTISDRSNRAPGKRLGEPLPRALEALQRLSDEGHQIIVHSCMAATPTGRQAIADWLEWHDIDVNGITATKPLADYYIDNKAIRHVDWYDTMAQLGILI